MYNEYTNNHDVKGESKNSWESESARQMHIELLEASIKDPNKTEDQRQIAEEIKKSILEEKHTFYRNTQKDE